MPYDTASHVFGSAPRTSLIVATLAGRMRLAPVVTTKVSWRRPFFVLSECLVA
jgi:hypothetical protein